MQAIGGKNGIAFAVYTEICIDILLVPPQRRDLDAEPLRDSLFITATSQKLQYLLLPFTQNRWSSFCMWSQSLEKSGVL